MGRGIHKTHALKLHAMCFHICEQPCNQDVLGSGCVHLSSCAANDDALLEPCRDGFVKLAFCKGHSWKIDACLLFNTCQSPWQRGPGTSCLIAQTINKCCWSFGNISKAYTGEQVAMVGNGMLRRASICFNMPHFFPYAAKCSTSEKHWTLHGSHGKSSGNHWRSKENQWTSHESHGKSDEPDRPELP